MSEHVEFSCQLKPCPLCEEPLITADGTIQNGVTYWARDAIAYATPHKPDCELAGEMIPDGLDLIALLKAHERRSTT